MNATARRRKYNDELRRVIVDAARDIFVREGYESFSMRRLAKKIEYSPGSVYLHFPSKEALFESLVERSFARLLKTLNGLRNGRDGKDAVSVLRRGLHAYVEFGLRNPNDYRFAFMLRPPAKNRPYRVHAAFDSLREIVVRCVKGKRLRAADVEITCQALWCAAHGVTSLLIQRPSFPWVAKRRLIAEVIDSATDGLLRAQISKVGKGGHHGGNRNK
jgi:AcrR family transcriptional regulator